jgi:AraC-like DNA-binding protein/quercetin dioxygenase-like cupin family protein
METLAAGGDGSDHGGDRAGRGAGARRAPSAEEVYPSTNEPVWAVRLVEGPEWSARPHRHRVTEVVVLAAGRFRIVTATGSDEAGAGDVLVFPAGREHGERSLGRQGVDLFAVALAWDPPAGFPQRLADRDGRVRQLARWLCESQLVEPGVGRPLRLAFTAALVAELRRLATALADPLIERVRAQLHADPATPRSVAGLARAAGLGRTAFCRRYRAATGLTPMADQRRLRALAAAELLASRDLTLAEVARRCGFCDVWHLRRIFTRIHGMPPGRYRRTLGTGPPPIRASR